MTFRNNMESARHNTSDTNSNKETVILIGGTVAAFGIVALGSLFVDSASNFIKKGFAPQPTCEAEPGEAYSVAPGDDVMDIAMKEAPVNVGPEHYASLLRAVNPNASPYLGDMQTNPVDIHLPACT